jgi:hypothetical protein
MSSVVSYPEIQASAATQEVEASHNAALATAAIAAILAILAALGQSSGSPPSGVNPGSNDPIQADFTTNGDITMSHLAPTAGSGGTTPFRG